jgi:transcriptional regulator with XRE-family HTH domain
MGTVERGESNLSFSNLVKISKALGVTLSQMLSGLEKGSERLAGDPVANLNSKKRFPQQGS